MTDMEKFQQMADRLARDRGVVAFAEKARKEAESVRRVAAAQERALESTRSAVAAAEKNLEATRRAVAAAERAAEPTLRVAAAHERERAKVAALYGAVREDASLRIAAAHADATAKLFDRITADRYEAVQALVKTPALAKTSEALTKYFDEHYESVRALVAPAVGSTALAASEAASRLFDQQFDSIRALVAPSAASALLAASDAAMRFWDQQGYDKVFASMAARVPDVAAESVEAVSRVLSDFVLPDGQVEDEGASTDHDAEDGFEQALRAFIAVGLVGRDFTVNTTTLAWLLTVENVRRVWGEKAARRALATFIAVAVTVLHAAWLTNAGGKDPSEAFPIAMAIPVTVLLYVWSRTDGK